MEIICIILIETNKYDYAGRLVESVKGGGSDEIITTTQYNYECAKQSLAVSVGENLTQEKASHHPVTVDLRPYW